MSRGWRYLLQRTTGHGANDEFIDLDLPLSNVEIESVLTGVDSLRASVTPEYMRLKDPITGRPLIQPWRTAIWAECDGDIRGGGIVSDISPQRENLGIECVGYMGYLDEMPYTDATFFVETDPLDILRHIVTHVQSQRNGDLGLVVDGLKSDQKIGNELSQGEFDTVNGPLSFEDGPFKLAWYLNQNLLDTATSLASDTPFDWRERHYWDDNTDQLRHELVLGYPLLGRRRNDLRFALGENIFTEPEIETDGAQYASEVLTLGAGEGRKMKRGSARRDIDGLRRVAVVTDPSLRTETACNKRAEREVAWRQALEGVTSLQMVDHPNAPMGSVEVGDEIAVSLDTGWGQVDAWFRVLGTTLRPESAEVMTLSVDRTDRIAA